MGECNGLWFSTLRIALSNLRARSGTEKSVEAAIPLNARVSDFGFDMRTIKRPGVLPFKSLPTIRARWNANVGVFQRMLDSLEVHAINLNPPPLTPMPMIDTSNMTATARAQEPLMCSLFELKQVIHHILEKLGPPPSPGSYAFGVGASTNAFMANDPVSRLLTAEELAAHLLAIQLRGHLRIESLSNNNTFVAKTVPWRNLLTAELVIRLARRSSCWCPGKMSSGFRGGRETFGEFAALSVTGEDAALLRDTDEWADEVRKYARSANINGVTQPGLPTNISSIDPRCWFNQLAMIHYPEADYFETGWLIRQWLKSESARLAAHEMMQQPCMCPAASSVDTRQNLLSQLPDSIHQLCEEIAFGDDLLAKSQQYPQGWELRRDVLSQWELP